MRRGKVELKRIEDKCNRLVSFSKRRSGLFKKALELSVLCDVQVAVAVISSSSKLYEFSGGNSFNNIIERYREHSRSPRTAPANSAGIGRNLTEAALGEDNHMVQIMRRLSEGQRIQELNAPDLMQLEHNLDAALRQTRRLIEEKMQLEAKAQDTMAIEALLPNEEQRMMKLNNYLEKGSSFPPQDMHGLLVTEEWSNLGG